MGKRDMPMREESEDDYLLLFRSLYEHGSIILQIVISNAHSGVVAAT